MENSIMTTAQAKEVLRKAGYFVEYLWQIEDVQAHYECTDEEAMNILESALGNEATMEQIFLAINMKAEEMNLQHNNSNQ